MTDKERTFINAVGFFRQWISSSVDERQAVGRDASEWLQEASFELADEIKTDVTKII